MVKQSTNTHRCCAKVKAARINWRTAWKQQLGLPFQLRKLRNKIKVIVRGSIFSALFDFRSMLARAKWYSYSMIIYRQSSRAIGTKKSTEFNEREKSQTKNSERKNEAPELICDWHQYVGMNPTNCWNDHNYAYTNCTQHLSHEPRSICRLHLSLILHSNKVQFHFCSLHQANDIFQITMQ